MGDESQMNDFEYMIKLENEYLNFDHLFVVTLIINNQRKWGHIQSSTKFFEKRVSTSISNAFKILIIFSSSW